MLGAGKYDEIGAVEVGGRVTNRTLRGVRQDVELVEIRAEGLRTTATRRAPGGARPHRRTLFIRSSVREHRHHTSVCHPVSSVTSRARLQSVASPGTC